MLPLGVGLDAALGVWLLGDGAAGLLASGGPMGVGWGASGPALPLAPPDVLAVSSPFVMAGRDVTSPFPPVAFGLKLGNAA